MVTFWYLFEGSRSKAIEDLPTVSPKISIDIKKDENVQAQGETIPYIYYIIYILIFFILYFHSPITN